MVGVDYFDIFCPVAKMVVVKSILAVVAVKGWYLTQLVVKNDFLRGELMEEVSICCCQ